MRSSGRRGGVLDVAFSRWWVGSGCRVNTGHERTVCFASGTWPWVGANDRTYLCISTTASYQQYCASYFS